MALLEMKEGSATASEISSVGLQPSPPSFLERIKTSPMIKLAEGVATHPWVALYWLHANYLPISGLFVNSYAKMKGIPEESIQYHRADAIFKLFGLKGLQALVDHFAPEISIEELMRRRLADSLPPSQQLRRTFGMESPLLDKGLPVLEADISDMSKSGKEQRNLVEQRVLAWDHILNTFLNPKRREKMTYPHSDRVAALRRVTDQIVTAPGRRGHPRFLCEEIIFASRVIRESLAREEAPEALEATGVFFSQTILAIARLIDGEGKDPIYPGVMPQTTLEEEMVAAALGLVSVANRRTNGADQEIENTLSVLGKIKTPDSGPNFTASVKKAMEILELVNHNEIPFYRQSFLRRHFGAGLYNPVFSKVINGSELTLKLDKDLNLFSSETNKPTIKDYRLFTALAMRFPFNHEITIIDGNGIVWALNIEAVRGQLFQGTPTDEVINSFISLAGEFQPRKLELIKGGNKNPIELSERQQGFKIAA